MSKDCPNCPAFGKHCPHKVNGDPYFYDCYLTVADLEKENAELKNYAIQLKTESAKKDTELTKQLLELDKERIKAKELLRDFLSVAIDYIDKEDKNYSFIVEAEQFLSEVEK